MGLFTKGTAEPVYCGFCGREIKAPKLFITRTMSGKAVCAKCLTERHLGDIQDKLSALPDEEIELFLDDMEENEERTKEFDPKLPFPEFKLMVDPVHQWVKFDDHHYIFEVSDFFAVVYSLTVDAGDAKGELHFYTIDPYYDFHKLKVKTALSGFLRSSQEKALVEKLEGLSAALGEVPVLTPKEFKKLHKDLLLEKEMEILEDLGRLCEEEEQ